MFSNDPKSLPRNPPHCPILCNWVVDNFILVDEPFAKALQNVITIYAENYSHHENNQKHLTKISKLIQYHFLFQILIY